MKFSAMLASSRKAISQARALAAVSELWEWSDGVAAIPKTFPGDRHDIRYACTVNANMCWPMTLAQIFALPVEQLERSARMGVRLFPDIPAMMEYFAGIMIEELRRNNQNREATRWILPVGPVAQYAKVVETCNRERISWRNVFVFQMDEFLDWQGRPVPLDHPFSFEGFMRRRVFEKLLPELRPAPKNLHFPNPFAPNRISEAIRAAGGVDTCFGGVGYHGHVAFNEPPISRWYKVSVEEMRESLTRVVALGDDSIVVQSILSA